MKKKEIRDTLIHFDLYFESEEITDKRKKRAIELLSISNQLFTDPIDQVVLCLLTSLERGRYISHLSFLNGDKEVLKTFEKYVEAFYKFYKNGKIPSKSITVNLIKGWEGEDPDYFIDLLCDLEANEMGEDDQ